MVVVAPESVPTRGTTMTHVQRALPGLAAPYVSIEVFTEPDGRLSVATWAGSGPGFRTQAQKDVYEHLSADEAQDVVLAVLDSLT